MRYASKKKIFYLVFFTAVLIFLLQPGIKTRRAFEIIEKQNIIRSLHEEITENYTSTAIVDCDYHDVIYDDTTLSATITDGDLSDGYRINEGGEYAPPYCKALFSSAIIVPYRDRAEQLRSFLVYMHSFLRRQNVHYRIYVVEQLDSQPFNRAKLINIGAIAAMNAGYPCLILHDVDLLPLKPANIYACTKYPRHLSGSYTKFRFILPYLNLGPIAIMAKQFKNINGMSNKYFNVIGEDDDLFARIESLMLKICQFEAQISEYHKIPIGHQGSWYNSNQKSYTIKGMIEDGLSSLEYSEVATVLHPLFTHIMVDL